MTSRMEGAGGTPGGMGEFFIGLLMAVAGGYLLTNQVTVTSGYWSLWGYNAFGLSLVPFLIGVAILFFNGGSKLGWLLTLAGVVIILAGILTHLQIYFQPTSLFNTLLMHLQIYFQPTSLFNTLLMLVLLFGGVGLMARGVRAH